MEALSFVEQVRGWMNHNALAVSWGLPWAMRWGIRRSFVDVNE